MREKIWIFFIVKQQKINKTLLVTQHCNTHTQIHKQPSTIYKQLIFLINIEKKIFLKTSVVTPPSAGSAPKNI